MRTLRLSFLLLALATPALASDGVLEINQTCAVNTGCFAGDAAAYPITITAPGSYRLTSNLIVPDEDTNGIEVSAVSVSIDLNGFEIVRSGCEGATVSCTPTSGTGDGVRTTSLYSFGVSVRNGTITGMNAAGIHIGYQSEARNLRVRWNRLDGINVSGSANVSGIAAYQNGEDGIDAGAGSTIIGNTSFGNGTTAGGDGIECDGGCLVRENSVRGNTGYGLNLPVESAYSDNVVTSNSAGTVTGGGSANSVGGNYCSGPGTVSASCP